MVKKEDGIVRTTNYGQYKKKKKSSRQYKKSRFKDKPRENTKDLEITINSKKLEYLP